MNTYNQGWRDYSKFNRGATRFQNPQQQPTFLSNSSMSLEDIVKNLAINAQKFQEKVSKFKNISEPTNYLHK